MMGDVVDLSQRNDLEQRQTLHLTTELRQGIAMLQLGAIDLGDYVRDRLEENPVLMEDRGDEQASSPLDMGESSSSLLSQNESAASVADANRTVYASESGRSGRMSTDALLEARGHGSPERFGNERRDLSQRDFSFDRFLASSETLYDYLVSQLNLQDIPFTTRRVCEYVIGNLDGNGYLKLDVADISSLLSIDPDEAAHALAIVQSLQPAGVGARNLAECLRLQLEERGLMEPPLDDLLGNHLGELETRSPASVAAAMGISARAMEEMLDVIRTCNPRPGAAFDSATDAVWPEVLVEEDPQSGYRVSLQDLNIPQLRIDEAYCARALSIRDGDALKYVKERIREAQGVIDGLEFRKQTLYKIACCIAESQYEFFEEGFDRLRPLTMAQVAEMAGVSESTVSRVANGNYMQTPRGTFELKFFFQGSLNATGNSEVSALSVKRRIRELVEAEDPRHPLSDQALSEQLQRDGVKVSRRTVAKYRGELGIPVRAARKKS